MAEQNIPGQQTTASNADAQNKLQSSKEHARKAAEDLKICRGRFCRRIPRQGGAEMGRSARQGGTSLG